MPGIELILLLLMPLLLAGSALCSSSETAIFSLTQADRLRLRRTHPGTHAAIATLLDSPRAFLIAVLLGNVAINSIYYVVASMIQPRLEGLWRIAFLVLALLAMIVCGEVLPKTIAAAHRVTLCRLLARPMLWWFRLIGPVRSFAEGYLIAPITRLLRPSGASAPEAVSQDDLAALLEAGGKEGVLHEGEQRLLADVVRLGSMQVREVMTPRPDISWIDLRATIGDLLALVRDTGHTRFPVCRGELDESCIAGFVNANRAVAVLNREPQALGVSIAGLVEPARFVPDRARLDKLLEQFRASGSEAVLCVNELGNLTGLVEIDAVIGELVGVPADGGQREQAQVRMVALGRWEVPGRMGVRDWDEFFGAKAAPNRRVSTVAGLILANLGRVPRVGEECVLGNLRLRVEEMDGRNIERVSVSLTGERKEAVP